MRPQILNISDALSRHTSKDAIEIIMAMPTNPILADDFRESHAEVCFLIYDDVFDSSTLISFTISLILSSNDICFVTL